MTASISHVGFDYAKYEALSYTWGSSTQANGKLYLRHSTPYKAGGNSNGNGYSGAMFLNIKVTLLAALRYLRLPDTPRVLWIDALCIHQESLTERSREVLRMGEIYNKAGQVVVWLGPEDADTAVAIETIRTLSSGVAVDRHRRLVTTKPGSEADILRKRPGSSGMTLVQWAALRSFIKRPWFQRLWIRQEVALATKVIVSCGHLHAEWEDVERVPLLLEHAAIRTHISLKDILFVRSLFRHHGSDDLGYIMHRSSMCGHLDDRDLVYANLSTSSAVRALRIKPDYTLPVAAVYKDLVLQHVQQSGTLDIMRWCSLQTAPPDFECFVPDFSLAKSESSLVKEYAHGGTRHLPIVLSPTDIPQLKGRCVGKVGYVSEHKKPLATDLVDHNGNAAVIMTYRRWEPQDLFTASYPTGGTLLHAFIALLTGGAFKEIYGGLHHPTREEAEEAYRAVVWSGGNLDLVSDPKFRNYIAGITSDRRGEVFFRTLEGHVGFSPGGVQTGDIISVLAGGSVPFVLRPAPFGSLDGCYRLVGPCYLQGVMFGEALLGPFSIPWFCKRDSGPCRYWCFANGQGGHPTLEDPRLWSLPTPWQIHYCEMDSENGPCDGNCQKHLEEGILHSRYFLNPESGESSRDDPRLSLAGLEQGGIVLDNFTLI